VNDLSFPELNFHIHQICCHWLNGRIAADIDVWAYANMILASLCYTTRFIALYYVF